MSRVGRSPIAVPGGVTVTVDGPLVTVAGPQGTLARPLPVAITVRQEDANLIVERPDDQRQNRALHGLTRSLVAKHGEPASPPASPRSSRSWGWATGPSAGGPGIAGAGVGLSPIPSPWTPRRRHVRRPHADPVIVKGIGQGEGGPGGGRYPQVAQARALQGQGRPVPRRTRDAQSRKGGQVAMATTAQRKRALRIRRHARVRKQIVVPRAVPAWPCSGHRVTSRLRSSMTPRADGGGRRHRRGHAAVRLRRERGRRQEPWVD